MQASMRTLSWFWNSPRWMTMAANALTAMCLFALIATAAWWFSERQMFRIREISVDATPGFELRHVTLRPLQQQLAGQLRHDRSSSFFRVNLDHVREVAESVPWVRHARVRRVWPNRLEIRVEEHEALALWDDGRIVNTYGELFSANLAEAEENGALPEFSGPAGTERAVVSRYAELRRLLKPLDVEPVALKLSTRQAWETQLSDGSKLLMGREQGIPIEERVRRWVAAYPEAKAKINGRAQSVDLRYPNGFALGDLTQVSENRTTP
jgi:cell division protein FtsQ